MEFKENETYVVVPKSSLDEIVKMLDELKELVKARNKEEAARVWLESEEARKEIGISKTTWQTFRANRTIPFSQFGRHIYVKRGDIWDFFEKHMNSAVETEGKDDWMFNE